ncbi:hypothetical protein E1B28_010458 [Marasmius oreades]|uniref:Uncharacterized protein n=1 Tax=Marasmius oreades TaxID=181124 RepID=A0A9P7RXC4_9AGAR|nr:uncharacterized protein E1B28_010458 [Marasmius oreades]KAG7091422.1 hypothetical protein E1B28_010458 [Marasmius oreades]
MPFSKPSSSSGSSSFFRNSSLTITPPTTLGKSSIPKSKLIIPKTLHQLFRVNANSLHPSSISPLPAANVRRASIRMPHLRRLPFAKPAPHPTLTTRISTPSAPYYRLMKHESRCLQNISSGIYVAFEDDARSFEGKAVEEELRAEDGRRFTHIIQISRTINLFSSPIISYSTDRHSTKHLHLSILPRPHDQYEHHMWILQFDPELTGLTAEQAEMCLDSSYFYPEKRFTLTDNGVTRLGSRQMAAAREFISRSTSTSRVLVTGPRDFRTDVMSIVACVLASTYKSPLADVVNSIDRLQGVENVWQGCISRVGVEYIQEVC